MIVGYVIAAGTREMFKAETYRYFKGGTITGVPVYTSHWKEAQDYNDLILASKHARELTKQNHLSLLTRGYLHKVKAVKI